MSLLDSAMSKLERMVDQKIEGIAPFRATVASVSTGMVTIKRLGVTTAETELRARVVGFDLAVNDEVLCVMVAGKPVVVGKMQRAAPAAADYSLPRLPYLVTLGPFSWYDLPVSSTVQGRFMFLAGATSVSDRQYTLDLQTTGEIVGMAVMMQAARTAGSITFRVRLSGVDTPFASDAVVLDGSPNSNTTAAWVAPGDGVSFTGSSDISMNAVTNGSLAPTTLEAIAWMYAIIDPV